MTTRYIDELSHCEHLLIVEGEAAAVAAFVAQARRDTSALSLEALLPAPATLTEVDPFMLAHFHLVFGEQDEARAIYDDIDEPWPLPDPDPDSRALREWLRTDPSLTANARQVQRNVVLHGALDVVAWKRNRWGAAGDLHDVTFEQVSDERVHYRFNDAASRMAALHAIAAKYPKLDVGAIVVDFGKRQQSWFYRFANDTSMRHAQAFLPEDESVVELYIDNPPDLFAYAG